MAVSDIFLETLMDEIEEIRSSLEFGKTTSAAFELGRLSRWIEIEVEEIRGRQDKEVREED